MSFTTLENKKRSWGETHPNYAMLVSCRARPGKAVDGVEADITGPPPHVGTGIQRRNLYWHNRVHTSFGRSDGLRSQGGQESLCWWLCSVLGPSPEKEKHTFNEKKKKASAEIKLQNRQSTQQRILLYVVIIWV